MLRWIAESLPEKKKFTPKKFLTREELIKLNEAKQKKTKSLQEKLDRAQQKIIKLQSEKQDLKEENDALKKEAKEHELNTDDWQQTNLDDCESLVHLMIKVLKSGDLQPSDFLFVLFKSQLEYISTNLKTGNHKGIVSDL